MCSIDLPYKYYILYYVNLFSAVNECIVEAFTLEFLYFYPPLSFVLSQTHTDRLLPFFV